MTEAGDAPERWTASRQAQAGIDVDWIDRFGDRNLVKLVGEAYDSNRNLRAAAARVDRAVAVTSLAGAAARP